MGWVQVRPPQPRKSECFPVQRLYSFDMLNFLKLQSGPGTETGNLTTRRSERVRFVKSAISAHSVRRTRKSNTAVDHYLCKHSVDQRIQTNEQVSCASMVPIGMDFCGSLKSPDMFDPVMIPAIHNTSSCESCCSVTGMSRPKLECLNLPLSIKSRGFKGRSELTSAKI